MRTSGPTRRAGAPAIQDVEHHHDALFLLTRLLDDLRAPAPRDRLREILAPTWVGTSSTAAPQSPGDRSLAILDLVETGSKNPR